jgi:hypothetical protein
LPISDRIKKLIGGVGDAEHPYKSRSEAVFAVILAMVGAPMSPYACGHVPAWPPSHRQEPRPPSSDACGDARSRREHINTEQHGSAGAK